MRLSCRHARVFGAVSCLILLLTAARVSAQSAPAFDRLATRVNVGDRVRVESVTGQRVTGRLAELTRRRLVVHASGHDMAFDASSVRTLSVAYHPLRRGVLGGAIAFAALGATATCIHEGGANCSVLGGMRAVPVGLGVGLAAGAVLTRMRVVYTRDNSATESPAAFATDSLLDDLGRTVNLNDRLRVTDDAGVVRSGTLTQFEDDALTVRTRDGVHQYTRATLQSVAVQRRPIRKAVLIGAATGAGIGAVLGCAGEDRTECADGPILLGGLGAVVGVVVGSLVRQTRVVFPDSERRTSLEPLVTPRGAGLALVRRW